MKRTSALMMMCLVNMSFFEGVAKPVKPKKVESLGKLRIVCEVDGARFVIDEGEITEKSGTLPSEDIALEAGNHTIKITKDGFVPYAEVITVGAGELLELEVDLLPASAKLVVSTNPVHGAKVSLDGIVIGTTPLEVDVPAGDRIVEIEMSGFAKEQRMLSLVPGKTETLNVSLSKLEVLKEKPVVPLYRKWWFWTAMGIVVTSAVLPSLLLSKKLKEYPREDAVLPVK